MEIKTLGRTGITLSALGLGTLTIGPAQKNLPLNEGAALIAYALNHGVDLIDTAQYYKTYPYIREALKQTGGHPVICSRSLAPDYQSMWDAIQEARDQLDLRFIDIFLLHEVRQDPDLQFREGAWEALREAKRRGLVKAIGISTHHTDVAQRAARLSDLDVLFTLINCEGLGIRTEDGPGTREAMEAAIREAHDAGKGVMAMKIFGGGNLTGQYKAAADYAKKLYGVDVLVTGMGSAEEVDRMIQLMDGTLPEKYVPDISRKRIRISQDDCEGCGACKARCPNHAVYWNKAGLADIDSRKCVNCGYCAPVCPVRAIIML